MLASEIGEAVGNGGGEAIPKCVWHDWLGLFFRNVVSIMRSPDRG